VVGRLVDRLRSNVWEACNMLVMLICFFSPPLTLIGLMVRFSGVSVRTVSSTMIYVMDGCACHNSILGVFGIFLAKKSSRVLNLARESF
jgi:hypothetical protein